MPQDRPDPSADRPPDPDRALIDRIAELEVAERRSRLGADHARRHRALLAEGSRALMAGSDVPTALAALVGVVVPDFADWCAVDVMEEGGISRVASAHADPRAGARLGPLLAEFPGWAAPVRRVMVSGRFELVWDLAVPAVHGEDGDHRAVAGALGLESYLIVPVSIRGLSVGAITCATAPPRRGYRPSDAVAVEELAAMTAMTLERISLQREMERAGAEAAERAGQLRRLTDVVRVGEERVLALVEAAPLAIMDLGLDGVVHRCNTAAQRLLGRPGAPAGESGIDFHPGTAAMLRRLVSDTVAGGPITDVEAVAWRSDGTEVPLSLSGAPLRDADGIVDGVLVLAADVTARRRLEDQVLRARRIETMGQMAGGVAHDFNNLLTVILGHATLLAADLPEDDPRRRDVEAISAAAERAAGITSQLLTISRGDLVSTEVFDVRARLRRVAETIRSVVPPSVDLVIQLGSGDHLVRMSPAQLDQVLLNLAVNARDAMPEGGTLAGRLTRSDESVVIEVADTGQGMDADTVGRCFEPFFTTKGGLRGTGLGLATVHSVVTGAGGEVTVASVPGEGTTFTVRLPRVTAGDEAVPAPDRAHRGAGSERILLVEDEDGLRRLAAEVLRSAGYVVVPAADGQVALELVASAPAGERPDLVVTDVVMPHVGGVELARRLAELTGEGGGRPAVPVLFMTGYADQTSREGLDGADVLIKPFHVDELVDKVRELLDRGRSGEIAAQGSKR